MFLPGTGIFSDERIIGIWLFWVLLMTSLWVSFGFFSINLVRNQSCFLVQVSKKNIHLYDQIICGSCSKCITMKLQNSAFLNEDLSILSAHRLNIFNIYMFALSSSKVFKNSFQMHSHRNSLHVSYLFFLNKQQQSENKICAHQQMQWIWFTASKHRECNLI